MVNVLYVMDKIKRVWGVTSVVRNYISHIDKNLVNIDVIAWDDSDSDLIQEFELMGTHVYFAPKLSLKNILEYSRFWDNFFKENNDYDIVHSHFNQIDYIVFKMAKKHGVKVCISHSHSAKYSSVWWKSIRNFVMCYPARYLSDYWAACSEIAGVGMYGKMYSISGKKLLIKNAINCNKFKYNEIMRAKLRDKYKLNNKKVIGMVGSFIALKNHEFMLNIAKELLSRDVSYYFLFIGEGELRSTIEEKINKLGISENITLTGAVSNVYDFYQMMDVFVMPSLFEGLPVTSMEAQAAGLPCVFSDTITQEVNLNKKAVRYVSLNDSTSKWAHIIESLIGKYPRDGVREIIREAGYDIEYEASNLSKFYLDCVSMKGDNYLVGYSNSI